ncbi:hypothetical protein FHW00_004806 [Ochrobactrum sp. P6BSIII]|nr:hypothetical protein [Ochrobactrum sp. P6BSIII]
MRYLRLTFGSPNAPIYPDLYVDARDLRGGSKSYYQLLDGAKELNDLIEHKGISFALGILKACYRFGEKSRPVESMI